MIFSGGEGGSSTTSRFPCSWPFCCSRNSILLLPSVSPRKAGNFSATGSASGGPASSRSLVVPSPRTVLVLVWSS